MSNNTTAEDAEDFIKETVKISVFTPIIYVGILMTIFVLFSINHRKRRLQQLLQIEPLFPNNDAATLYGVVKQLSQSNVPALQKPNEAVLKAALLRRAGEAIKRSMKLKEFEAAFEKLYHDGLIGDDIYKQHGIQSKMQELELQEIVKEATEIKADWVQTFFPVAQEICFNEAMRRRFYAMEQRAIELTKQWELQPPVDATKSTTMEKSSSSSEIKGTSENSSADKKQELVEKTEDNKATESNNEDQGDEKIQKKPQAKPSKTLNKKSAKKNSKKA